MRRGISLLGVMTIFAAVGCGAPTAATASDCSDFTPTSTEICVTGASRYYGFEGGFWAVRGDDGITYDPLGALPAAFRRDGLRVRLVARVRNDLMSFHQAGPIVEIIDIRRL
jgi:hypothetical protein